MSERTHAEVSEEIAGEGAAATGRLLGSMSRRTLMRRGALGGAAVAGSGLFSALAAEAAQAHHHPSEGAGVLAEPHAITPALQIFQIATIAEQLAVTFYGNGVANASALGLADLELNIIKAAGIEEQIHQQFFTAVISLLTNKPAPTTFGATTFSFPAGDRTFSDLATFIATQQALEGVFDSAFLAAIRELSHQGMHRAAQIAGQVATIESEHRALGRSIAAQHGIETLPNPLPGLVSGTLNPAPSNPEPDPVPTDPADDWAFTPVFFRAVKDAPGLVQQAGFLSPTDGNSYDYQQIDFSSSDYAAVYAKIFFREPTINLGSGRWG